MSCAIDPEGSRLPPRACRRDVYHGICGLEPVYPDFHARAPDWYPTTRRSIGSGRQGGKCRSRSAAPPAAASGRFFFGQSPKIEWRVQSGEWSFGMPENEGMRFGILFRRITTSQSQPAAVLCQLPWEGHLIRHGFAMPPSPEGEGKGCRAYAVAPLPPRHASLLEGGGSAKPRRREWEVPNAVRRRGSLFRPQAFASPLSTLHSPLLISSIL